MTEHYKFWCPRCGCDSLEIHKHKFTVFDLGKDIKIDTDEEHSWMQLPFTDDLHTPLAMRIEVNYACKHCRTSYPLNYLLANKFLSLVEVPDEPQPNESTTG